MMLIACLNGRHCSCEIESGWLRCPQVILASLASLEGGPSRELLLEFCKQSASSVVLTDRSTGQGAVAEWLLQHAGSPAHGRPPMPLTMAKHVPLQGEKLEGARALSRALRTAP